MRVKLFHNYMYSKFITLKFILPLIYLGKCTVYTVFNINRTLTFRLHYYRRFIHVVQDLHAILQNII